MKILIVEDEDILSKVLEEKFKKWNFDVKIASNGEEALEEVLDFKPDVIALDLMLPKIDGFEVLKELKSKSETKTIPVIVVSNLSEDADIQKAMKLGAVDYYIKSTHPINEIVEKVKAVLLNGKK